MAVTPLNPTGIAAPHIRHPAGTANQAFRNKSRILQDLRLSCTAAVLYRSCGIGHRNSRVFQNRKHLSASCHLEYTVYTVRNTLPYQFLPGHAEHLVPLTLQFGNYCMEHGSIALHTVRREYLLPAYSKIPHPSNAICPAFCTSLRWSTSITRPRSKALSLIPSSIRLRWKRRILLPPDSTHSDRTSRAAGFRQ